MRKLSVRTSYEIYPEDIRQGMSEYILKHFGVYIEPKNITDFDGSEITEIIKGRTVSQIEEKKPEVNSR